MRIAINTRFLLTDKMEGFGWYTYEIVRRICKNNPQHHFIFLFDRPFDKKFIFSDNITPVIIGPQARHPFLFYWWFEFSVAKALKKHKADVFFSPDGYLSLRSKLPAVAVMHDINFEHFPKDLSFLVRNYYRYFFPKFAKKAKQLITVSEFSKQDIISHYGIDASKIHVVYNGVNTNFKVLPNNIRTETRQAISQGLPYFLFVGALHPRKNLSRLFEAFDKFKSEHSTEIKLVIIGEKYFWNQSIEKSYSLMRCKNDVIFTGHLQEDDLIKLYNAAHALIFVSYFEGFGLPLVEAMACELPILTANTSALPEIAGDAALYCNPYDVADIATAMKRINEDTLLRNNLIEKGRIQLKQFSWDQAAQNVMTIIEKTSNA